LLGEKPRRLLKGGLLHDTPVSVGLSFESRRAQQKEFEMKKIGIAALAVALASSGAAYGADVFGNGSTKDAPTGYSAGVVNWTGFYVGGFGGYGNANHNLSVHEYTNTYCEFLSKGGSPETVTSNSYFSNNDKDVYGECAAPSAATSTSDGAATVAGTSEKVGSLDGVNSRGAFGGAQIGFDVARGRLLFGVFADYMFTNMETSAVVNAGPVALNFGLEKQDEWTIGGRVGYLAAPRTLVYLLAGYTQTEYEVTGLSNVKAMLDQGRDRYNVRGGATFDGLTVGGGIEFALTSNIFLGMEYRHFFGGEETILNAFDPDCNDGLKVMDDLDEDKIMATLKIKLNGGALPGFSD
jgi:outer membrane immunogenic protein